MSGEEVKAAGGGGGLTLGWGMGGSGGGRGGPCDSCDSPAESYYRRSDSAFLLCDVCERAPAHVTCKADDAALCVACDRDIHSANPLASRHERVPITSPLHPPPSDRLDSVSASEDAAEAEAATWILPDLKPAGSPEMELTRYSFETDPYLDLDYPPMDPKFNAPAAAAATDCVVPVQSKTEAAAAAVVMSSAIPESRVEFDFGGSKYNAYTVPCSSSVESGLVPDSTTTTTTAIGGSSGGVGCVSSANRTVVQITGVDREARVLRYREKRKTRRFEKTIRYASRKAYAETRPRIKGRFAKRVEMEADVDRMYGSPDVLSADAGYGVVPSF